MKRPEDRTAIYRSLLSVQTSGCSPASLDELAERLLRQFGFGAVTIALGPGAGWAQRAGRAGSRGARRTLDARCPVTDDGPPAAPARTQGASRSWPIEDLGGSQLGQLHCLLGRSAEPPSSQQLVLIELLCRQLGVAAGQLTLANRLHQAEQDLQGERTDRWLAERALELVFDESAIGMATVSLSPQDPGRLLSVNDALCHLTDRSAAGLLALTSAELTHPDDRAIGNSALRRAMAGRRTPVRSRRRLLRGDGGEVWVQVTACPLFDQDDRPSYAILQFEDLSPRQDAEVELAARQDPLTGLLTGEALDEAMVEVLDRARRLDTTGAVLICDLDRLAAAAGDPESARRMVARTLASTLRNGDLIARVTANRFAVVAEEVRPEHAATLADRITEALGEAAGSIDLGISVLTPASSGPQTLFQQATDAMLGARQSGQRYTLYARPDPDTDTITSQVLYRRPGWHVQR